MPSDSLNTTTPTSSVYYIQGAQDIKGFVIQTQRGPIRGDLSTTNDVYATTDFAINPVSGTLSFGNTVVDQGTIDFSRIKPLGAHFTLGGGGTTNKLARILNAISPNFAKKQMNNILFGQSEHIFKANTNTPYQIACMDYIEFFEAMVRPVLSWLAPEMISGQQSDYCAFLSFHVPHGKIYDIPPYGYDETKNTEYDYLADNFYERCRAMRKLGVITQAHHGSVEHHHITRTPQEPKLEQLRALHNMGNVGIGQDAAVIYQSGGVAWDFCNSLNSTGISRTDGYGVYIEGIPQTGGSVVQPAWHRARYPMMVVGNNEDVHIGITEYSGIALPNSSGKWPIAGTSGFYNAFKDTYIFIQFESSHFNYGGGPTSGVGNIDGSIFAKAQFCSGYMSGIRNVIAQIESAYPPGEYTKVIPLLPSEIIHRMVDCANATGSTNPRFLFNPQQFCSRTY